MDILTNFCVLLALYSLSMADNHNVDRGHKSLEDRFNALSKRFVQMEKKLNEKEAKLCSIDEEQNQLENQIQELKQRIMQQEHHFKEREVEIMGRLNELEMQHQLIFDFSGQRGADPKIYSGEFVGFIARPSKNYFYEIGDRIIYDDVVLNPSNSYNITTSSFACPFSGFYQFTVTVASAMNADNIRNRIDGRLFIDGQEMLKAIAPASEISITQGTITGIYRCEQGVEVYVIAGGSGGEVGNYGNKHSVFAGHLVRMDTY